MKIYENKLFIKFFYWFYELENLHRKPFSEPKISKITQYNGAIIDNVDGCSRKHIWFDWSLAWITYRIKKIFIK